MCDAITKNGLPCNNSRNFRYGKYCGIHKHHHYKDSLHEKRENKLSSLEREVRELRKTTKTEFSALNTTINKEGKNICGEIQGLRQDVQLLAFSNIFSRCKLRLEAAPLADSEIEEIRDFMDKLPSTLKEEEAFQAMNKVPVFSCPLSRYFALKCTEGKLFFTLIWEYILRRIENEEEKKRFRMEMEAITPSSQEVRSLLSDIPS